MARAVMLPITDFKPGTPRLDGRTERLKAMMAISDAHDSEVRNRMFCATFAPDAIKANESRPEITPQTTPEVLAALDSLRRCKEYNARALESRQSLTDALKKYDGGSNGATVAGARRDSSGVAFVAPMGAPVATMKDVKRTVAAPSPPVMATTSSPTSSTAPKFPPPSASSIDASRDPRRR